MELQPGKMRKVLQIKDDDSGANMNRTNMNNCTFKQGGWQDVSGGKGAFPKPEDLDSDPWDPHGVKREQFPAHCSPPGRHTCAHT